MSAPLWTLPGIRIVERKTSWFYWHCPLRGCKKSFEYTVPKFTERQAIRHLEAHRNRKKRNEAYKAQLEEIKKNLETDISSALEG